MDQKLLEELKESYVNFISTEVPLTDEWGREATIKEALGGNILDEEAIALYDIVQKNTNVLNVLQIGTYIGYSGIFLAIPLKERKGTLTTIDPNHPHRNINSPLDWAKKVYKKLDISNVNFIEGYSNKQNSIYDQTQRFVKIENLKENVLDDLIGEKKKFDLIFIDGCHDPRIVIQDFEKSLQLLNLNGFIIMHDVRGTQRVQQVAEEMKVKYGTIFNYSQVETPAGLGIFEKVK